MDADEAERRTAEARRKHARVARVPDDQLRAHMRNERALLTALDRAEAERDALRAADERVRSIAGVLVPGAETPAAIRALVDDRDACARERDEAEAKLASMRCLVAEAQRDAAALRAELAAARSATLDEAIARVAAWGETEHDYADPYWRGYRSGNDDAVVELRLTRDGEPSVSPPRSPTSEEP